VSAALAFCAATALAGGPYELARESMVRNQIQDRGIRQRDLLRVLRATPRHLFVPENVRDQAYQDHPLPIGHGQTISQPYIVAFMTELLDPKPAHKVLEIGTGSGYQAAVLAPLVGHVYTIEIVEPLARSAEAIFGQLSLRNITVRCGDGYKGWPEQAPFDRIIVTAAPPEMPGTLLDQLKRGGKLVAPVGGTSWDQELYVYEKNADGKVRRRAVLPVRFVPMVRGR
jgi:protein-L-isoaspartate(D-aspartate) O-methyltransferase